MTSSLRLALLPLLAGMAIARAEIVVEDRPLSTPRPVAATPAPVVTAIATPAAESAPAESSASTWDMYSDLQRLQDEVGQLRGQVEQQAFLIEKLQNDLRSRYLDLDQRLTSLQEQQKSAPASAAEPPVEAVPASATIEEESKAYRAAYETFRSGGADKAIPPMLAFVKRYPNSSLTPNAYYWLGEFYLNASTADPASARKNFETVLEHYPASDRAPAALYKIGSILDLQGKPQEAGQKMKELLGKYPKSAEAALAESYLKALEASKAPAPANKAPARKG